MTADVIRLAQLVWSAGAFGLLPILGDAPTDAGCGDEEILGTCRAAVGGKAAVRLLDRLIGIPPGGSQEGCEG